MGVDVVQNWTSCIRVSREVHEAVDLQCLVEENNMDQKGAGAGHGGTCL